MGQSIVLGAIEAGVLDAGGVCVSDPHAPARARFAERGVAAVSTIAEAMSWLAVREVSEGAPGRGQVLLAVKPQSLEEAGRELAGAWGDGERVVISILAGARSERVRAAVGGRARVVRSMPNTPARIRRGVTAVALGSGAIDGDEGAARSLFAALGDVVDLCDEALFDAFTAIAGSGPAYLFYLAEALIDAATRVGLSADVARTAVIATLAGSAELLARDPAGDAAALRAAVSSRGGVTLAATGVLDTAGVKANIERAVRAGVARGRELAG